MDKSALDHQDAQSRTLTKKQLSEMAFGIRELAKKLQHIRLKLDVRNLFVLTKAHDESLIQFTRELSEWLLSQEEAGYIVYADDPMRQIEMLIIQQLGGENHGRKRDL